MAVNLLMRSSTDTFCTTSSRVGQMHSACGAFRLESTRDSIPNTKHVVFPLPLCAWAIKLRYGGCSIIGSVSAWMRDGFSNFISVYSPLSSSGHRSSSSNVFADTYGDASLAHTLLISVSSASTSLFSSFAFPVVESGSSTSAFSPPSLTVSEVTAASNASTALLSSPGGVRPGGPPLAEGLSSAASLGGEPSSSSAHLFVFEGVVVISGVGISGVGSSGVVVISGVVISGVVVSGVAITSLSGSRLRIGWSSKL
mmetsp:Transcript_35418/g.59699  ORF Transcript_35418/g.59699 Transcript_35418/m.59699 type:complete len:255 (+) Transcript_35418:1140-1904(+)